MLWSEEKAYRVYVTDTLRNINDILAHTYGGNYIQTRYADLMDDTPQDTRTGDEIAKDIIKRAGLKTGGQANGSDEPSGDSIA